jgi:hypothetical protein
MELTEKFEPVVRGVPGSDTLGSCNEKDRFGWVDLTINARFSSHRSLMTELTQPQWRARSFDDERPDIAHFQKLDPVEIKRNRDRFVRTIVLPPAIRKTLETKWGALVGSMTWSLMILFLPLRLWPVMLWCFALLNGITAMQQRAHIWEQGDNVDLSQVAYRIWTEQIGDSEITRGATQVIEVQYTLYQIQKLLLDGAMVAEKVQSLFSFADPALSVAAYFVMLVPCLLLYVLLSLAPIQWLLAAGGSTLIMVAHISYPEWESVEDKAVRMNEHLRRTNFGLLTLMSPNTWQLHMERAQHIAVHRWPWTQKLLLTKKRKLSEDTPSGMLDMAMKPVNKFTELAELLYHGKMVAKFHQAATNFFARVPAERELAHRFVATRLSSLQEDTQTLAFMRARHLETESSGKFKIS